MKGGWFHTYCCGLVEDDLPDEWFCSPDCRRCTRSLHEGMLCLVEGILTHRMRGSMRQHLFENFRDLNRAPRNSTRGCC
ncbi:hypothetical protein MAR_006443 [Mya arenaria]|uniref:Uncharacterized protein n=1 Tax=Mya arenaria TaxID=6604 RepID=A0ABY7D8I1_MYAAR|nr:hypothetical protein MAR_006443 [Mya arenaria]